MTEEPRERKVRSGRISRTAPLVALAGRTAGEAVVAALRGGDAKAEFHRRAAERYTDRLGRSRGVLMKAGQLMSVVSFGPGGGEGSPYQAALARLQDSVEPMPPELALETLEAGLGRSMSEAYAEFDPVAFAAASIGQVHRARLHDGRPVAVKVQYPGVADAIRADLANAELLATFVRLGQATVPIAQTRHLDVRGMAREIGDRIGEEVDYLNEAANQRDFADIYRGHPFVHVPEVVSELTTRRVLTTDLATGLRFADAVRAPQELRDRWGEAIYRFSLGSLHEFGLFNADPHPGNFLFHEDGTITALDFGCVKRFPDELARTIRTWLTASVAGDAATAFDAYASGLTGDRPTDQLDPQALLAWTRGFLTPIVSPQPFTYTPEVAARIAREEFNPVGPHAPTLRWISLSPEMAMLSRIDTGMTGVLGELRSGGDWRALFDEIFKVGPPAGHYGRAHADFVAERGLVLKPEADHV
ncbi:ABC1 kinase family protein [Actinomadura hibisca]|uniref:ABC1 kinase family protein n=1 Tax=Actinomadura hibisca TaxID=68565 RepID=UPI00082B00A1|nr:AarF/ABC1/UbiB kinase family protein [Actinomadura hibisca]